MCVYLSIGAVQLQSVHRGMREQHQLHLLQLLPATSSQDCASGSLLHTQTHLYFTYLQKEYQSQFSFFVLVSASHTACCFSCCRRRYILVLMECNVRRCVSDDRSSTATHRSLRPARGRYQQNLYWSCFLGKNANISC